MSLGNYRAICKIDGGARLLIAVYKLSQIIIWLHSVGIYDPDY